jgi:uncharacterized phage protein gp47/JayE
MSYTPPYVGPAGLVVSNYNDILVDNVGAFLNIYGQNQYVQPDAPIYQLLSILSLKQADQNAALQLYWNQSSPQTAVGAGLDRVLKMNGLARAAYTYSTAVLTVTGTSGAVITNGFAQDQSGNLWALPSPVTIVGGSVSVTATCTTPGNITAEPGTITIVATPQYGWTPPSGTVTNAAAAVSGDPVETDSEVRARQAISVALPALTPLAATIAAVLAVPGVTNTAPGQPTPGGPGSSIENPTASTDSWGNPPHSVSLVVNGGTDLAVAQAIYAKKTIGCLSNGTTSVVVTDPTTGYEETISFYRPTLTPIFALITVHGYAAAPTSATLATIQAAVAAYLNELAIGETVSAGAVNYEVMAVNGSLISPSFGVRGVLLGTLSASTTSSITSGSPTMIVTSATGIVDGQLIVAAGVPAGTSVSSISGTNITMSALATSTATGVATEFSTLASSDVAMANYYYSAEGLAANIAVVAV